MMWHTHAAIGASTTWLLMPFLSRDDSVIVMVFCVIGALVPDLDAVESKIKHVKIVGVKPLVLVSRAINREFSHRGLLHSLRGWVGWTLPILPLDGGVGWLYVTALSLGHASHLVGDACAQSSIPMSYLQRKNYHLLPIQVRVIIGSAFEELFFVVFSLLTLILLLTWLKG